MNNKYKLLVIEDETNIRSFVKTILDTNGYQVLTAGSVKQGLLVYSSHNPDLVLLDLGLPDEDGMHFIKRYGRQIPLRSSSCQQEPRKKIR